LLNVRAILGALAVAAIASPAMAQTSSSPPTAVIAPNTDPLVAYRAYNQALETGTLEDAARYATQAWQLAEAKWGPTNPNTGGLAFNAAWSAALVGKSTERMDAAKRAVELVATSGDAYALPEAQFLLAYAEFFATDMKDRPKMAPKLAEATAPVEATWRDYLVVNALINAAVQGAVNGRGRATIRVAERTLVAIDRLTPTDNNSRALALLARAQGRLMARDDQEEAVADLIQARVLYGPMRSVDDSTWGSLAAWETASRSVVKTVDNFNQTTGSRIAPRTSRPMQMTADQMRIIYGKETVAELAPVQCRSVVRRRKVGREISYPPGEARDLRVAGVVVRHDLDAQGRAVNVRLLGAVPPGPFCDNAMAAISTWVYTLPANAPTVCVKDRDISVSFVIG
jgi:hypothetical protein